MKIVCCFVYPWCSYRVLFAGFLGHGYDTKNIKPTTEWYTLYPRASVTGLSGIAMYCLIIITLVLQWLLEDWFVILCLGVLVCWSKLLFPVFSSAMELPLSN